MRAIERIGDRVVPESLLWCQRCPSCRRGRFNTCQNRQVLGIHVPGGMAEAQAVPARLLHLPSVRVRQLAAEPGGEAYAAALRALFDLEVSPEIDAVAAGEVGPE